MGYMKHHAIVVTTWDDTKIGMARDKAIEFGNHVSEIVGPVVEGYVSFLIAPDGSKEGWEESDIGNSARFKFMQWANEQRYEDGSCWMKWVEVQFADDDDVELITNSSARKTLEESR